MLEAVSATETPGWLRQVPAVQTLRLTRIQQYYRGGDGNLHVNSVEDPDGVKEPLVNVVRPLTSAQAHRRPG